MAPKAGVGDAEHKGVLIAGLEREAVEQALNVLNQPIDYNEAEKEESEKVCRHILQWTLKQTLESQGVILSLDRGTDDQSATAAASAAVGSATGNVNNQNAPAGGSTTRKKRNLPKIYKCPRPECVELSDTVGHCNDHIKRHVGTVCFWINCSFTAKSEDLLQKHIYAEHIDNVPVKPKLFQCKWQEADGTKCKHKPVTRIQVQRQALAHSYDRGTKLEKLDKLEPVKIAEPEPVGEAEEEVGNGEGGEDVEMSG
ncbi:hypothetical protein F4821DRAFT_259926 [Hypoxylon rubiginosum]|uniref:Uncharacterized protein n=1 Tax=Hypoxylon rubiginosum TaxID=110542 RepID=A0ACC0D1B7_9PEZI|nr:hypothetical protein F4821DRAFT_259926 [Hypoxylon rubiginosum]